eukprot:scaffold680132_cov42-Prasinocladus_malaysianus.AAC.1
MDGLDFFETLIGRGLFASDRAASRCRDDTPHIGHPNEQRRPINKQTASCSFLEALTTTWDGVEIMPVPECLHRPVEDR